MSLEYIGIKNLILGELIVISILSPYMVKKYLIPILGLTDRVRHLKE